MLSRIWVFLKRAIALLAYSYSALIIVYFLLRIIFWDRFWVVGFVSSFIPLILLPILILPVLALGIVKRRWFSIASSIACILLISWLHLKYFSPHPIQANASQLNIKVLSLNCSWYKTSSENLTSLIQKEAPDIVFLQEVVKKHTQRAFVWLKSTYPYQFAAPETGILSKYPIEFSEILHLAGHRDIQQRAIIKIDNRDIVVYNIQVKSPWINYQKVLPLIGIPFYDYRERSQEIQDLLQRLQKETLPLIVAGDFNMTDQSQDYHYLTTVLQNSFHVSGLGFGFTWPHGWELSFLIKNSPWKLNYPIFRIDHIWYSKHWGSRASKVLPTTGSDHLPVETELQWM
ncbi:endonuclease/exonuclease/phosphatase family protein [Aerosakkonema sp. BLCC-F183]|uniref:endonuclease/exonuclease/phosphatase family protein n=1 Tax=Aerosakkonema sp. BLCC-F183 TaxID=3342834 RepID=UPI0035BA20E3